MSAAGAHLADSEEVRPVPTGPRSSVRPCRAGNDAEWSGAAAPPSAGGVLACPGQICVCLVHIRGSLPRRMSPRLLSPTTHHQRRAMWTVAGVYIAGLHPYGTTWHGRNVIVDAEIVTGHKVGGTQLRTSASCPTGHALRSESRGRRRGAQVDFAFTATTARVHVHNTVNDARPGVTAEPGDHEAARRETGQRDRLRPGARDHAPGARRSAAGPPSSPSARQQSVATAPEFEDSRAVTLRRCEGGIGGIVAHARGTRVLRLPHDPHRSPSSQWASGVGTRPEGRSHPRRCARLGARTLVPPTWAACVDHRRTGRPGNGSRKPTGPGGEVIPPGPVNQQPHPGEGDLSSGSAVVPAQLEQVRSVSSCHHVPGWVRHPQPAACACRPGSGGADAASSPPTARPALHHEPAFQQLANRSGGGW